MNPRFSLYNPCHNPHPHLTKAKKTNKTLGFLFDLKVFIIGRVMVSNLFCLFLENGKQLKAAVQPSGVGTCPPSQCKGSLHSQSLLPLPSCCPWIPPLPPDPPTSLPPPMVTSPSSGQTPNLESSLDPSLSRTVHIHSMEKSYCPCLQNMLESDHFSPPPLQPPV